VILGRDVGEEFLIGCFVLGPDRANVHRSDAGKLRPGLPFRRIRPDCHRHAGCGGLVGHRDPRIERHDAGFIGNQRIDVDLADLGMARSEIGEADQDQGNAVEIDGRPVAISLE
jgi:hypothetical protein